MGRALIAGSVGTALKRAARQRPFLFALAISAGDCAVVEVAIETMSVAAVRVLEVMLRFSFLGKRSYGLQLGINYALIGNLVCFR